MKHKIILSIGIFLLLGVTVFGTLGCATKPASTPAQTFVTTETFNQKMAEMQGQMNNKAEQTALTAQAARIDGIAGQSAGLTEAQINALMDAKIATLKAGANPWASSSSGGTTTGDYGELVDSDGDLELWLEKTPSGSADSELFYTSAGTNKASFDFTVVNTDGSARHDFWIKLSFMPDEDTLPTTALAGCAAYEVKISSVTASAESTLEPFTYSVTSATCLDENDEITLKSDEDNINKGDTESYRITVYINQDVAAVTNVEWFIDYTIKDLD